MDSKLGEEFDREYDLLKHEIDRAEALQKGFGGTNSSTSNINVNAGGPAVWIATTACIAMLAVNVILVAIIIDYGRRIDRVEDYSYAAYMISGKQQEKRP